QVELQAALVAMQVLKVGPGTPDDRILAAGRRRLDADDVRAPVGEVAHAGRSGARKRQIDHPQTAQRKIGLRLVLRYVPGFSHDAPGQSMIPKSVKRLPACAKPSHTPAVCTDASAGEGRSEKIMLHQ